MYLPDKKNWQIGVGVPRGTQPFDTVHRIANEADRVWVKLEFSLSSASVLSVIRVSYEDKVRRKFLRCT